MSSNPADFSVDPPKTIAWKNPKLEKAIDVASVAGGKDKIDPLFDVQIAVNNIGLKKL